MNEKIKNTVASKANKKAVMLELHLRFLFIAHSLVYVHDLSMQFPAYGQHPQLLFLCFFLRIIHTKTHMAIIASPPRTI